EIEADAVGPFGRSHEGCLQRLDLGKGIGLRRMPARSEGDGRCRLRLPSVLIQRIGLDPALPGALAGGLASRMAELDADLGCTVALAGIDDAFHRRLVLAICKCRAAVRDPPDELDACRFHDEKAGA